MHVVHAMAVGAAVAAFLFALLWASEAAGFDPLAPQWPDLLRIEADGGSWATLGRGMPGAIVLGAAAGAAIAVFANALRFLDRR
jgi:hypothetical protein